MLFYSCTFTIKRAYIEIIIKQNLINVLINDVCTEARVYKQHILLTEASRI